MTRVLLVVERPNPGALDVRAGFGLMDEGKGFFAKVKGVENHFCDWPIALSATMGLFL